MSPRRAHLLAVGAALSIAAGAFLAFTAVYAAWVHNPQGEFHGADGEFQSAGYVNWADLIVIGLGWFLSGCVAMFLALAMSVLLGSYLSVGARPAGRWKAHPHVWRAMPTLAVVGLATLSFLAWRIEVERVKGWDGLQWLESYPWSAPLICVFVALAALTPAAFSRAIAPVRQVLFVALASVTGWVSFEVARRWFHEDVNWLAFSGEGVGFGYWLRSPVLSVLLCAAGYHFCVRSLLARTRHRCLALYVAAVVLVWPLSDLSIWLLPAHGYTDELHAVKAGYPMFWIVVTMATAVAAAIGPARGAAAS